MPGGRARAGRGGHEQGGLRACGDHSPNLPWFPLTTGLTCFCAAMRFWSLFLQAGSCRCWKVSYPVVIPEGRRTWEKSRASIKLLEKLLHLLLEHRTAFPTRQPGWPQWGPGEETRKRAISSQEGAETPYLETGSFDTSIKLVVLPSPAPEAVGHAIALEREQHRASQGSAQLHGLRGADTSPASPLLPPSSSDHRLCPQTISIPFPTSQVHHDNVIAPAPNCPGHPTQELTSS